MRLIPVTSYLSKPDQLPRNSAMTSNCNHHLAQMNSVCRPNLVPRDIRARITNSARSAESPTFKGSSVFEVDVISFQRRDVQLTALFKAAI
jgi:hypothetical protein